MLMLAVSQPCYCQIGKAATKAAKVLSKRGSRKAAGEATEKAIKVGEKAAAKGTSKAVELTAKELAEESARMTISHTAEKSLTTRASRRVLRKETMMVERGGMSKAFRQGLEHNAIKNSGKAVVKGAEETITARSARELTGRTIKKEFGSFESREALQEAGRKQLKRRGELATNKKVAIRAARTVTGQDALKLLDDTPLLKKQIMEMGSNPKLSPTLFSPSNLQIEQAGRHRIISFKGTNTKIEVKGNKIYAKGGSTSTNGAMNEFLNNPLPNSTYNVDKFSIFTTDAQGKTIFSECHSSELSKSVSRSNLASQNQVPLVEAKGGKRGIHDSGHIQQHSTGGQNESINLLPMRASKQRGGQWANFEKIERDAITEGKDVWSRKWITYKSDGSFSIKAELKINDPTTGKTKTVKRTFSDLY